MANCIGVHSLGLEVDSDAYKLAWMAAMAGHIFLDETTRIVTVDKSTNLHVCLLASFAPRSDRVAADRVLSVKAHSRLHDLERSIAACPAEAVVRTTELFPNPVQPQNASPTCWVIE